MAVWLLAASQGRLTSVILFDSGLRLASTAYFCRLRLALQCGGEAIGPTVTEFCPAGPLAPDF
jgi:hypothetical protein